ncbi:MAG: NADH-quinone oxidoreductase subunit NuoG [Bryobacterales bacterium]|nr:NADH-quinone oxidoreductase subunit NuoG [Bryobacterales bacterium]
MAELVSLTIDGRTVQVPPGTLVIDAAKKIGVEVPAFCYYEGLSLQAACRMCLVEVEKMPKLMAGCTLPVAEGMVVRTETPTIAKARKSTLEFLLTNHPLDCPVCDKGGECELQDMVFRYGAGESRYTEIKHHVDEKQWSPVVYFDAPRCILCYRCVRICDEGMGVGALGVINRGVVSEIAPNKTDHLECDECGMCIDICPVGALTSGAYRYKTRPWEMQHVGTICTHCSNGCKTTLGVRNNEIMRGDNRDQSGVNGEFLCIKGRYAFDFYHHQERLQSPLVRKNGKLEPVSWKEALEAAAARLKAARDAGSKIGVIGSTRTSNEENFYLQKFARLGLGTNHIDHHRTGDVVTLLDALSGQKDALATTADLYEKPAIVVLGADLALEHPLLSFQIRANFRHHQARVYAVTEKPVREDKYAAAAIRCDAAGELAALETLREKLANEPELVIVFGDTVKGDAVRKLVAFGSSLGKPVKYVALVDYSNSRGAMDMGLVPELLPGYRPSGQTGMSAGEMVASGDLDMLYIVGANPLEGGQPLGGKPFVIVHEMFLTETAQAADIVFPASSAYEKNGTVTSVTGEVQQLKKAVQAMGTKPDLEILGLLVREMGLAAQIGPWTPDKVFQEIRETVPGYNMPLPVIATGGAVQTAPVNGRIEVDARPDLVRSSRDGLFTSGTLGRYSKVLNSVVEGRHHT